MGTAADTINTASVAKFLPNCLPWLASRILNMNVSPPTKKRARLVVLTRQVAANASPVKIAKERGGRSVCSNFIKPTKAIPNQRAENESLCIEKNGDRGQIASNT